MAGLNVLIVDDAPFIREVLRQIIAKAGHTVVGEAENGEEAVRMALEMKPELVIMDIVMPLKSGVQATKEIAAALPHTKVVACSTVDQNIMLIKALEAGASEYITKPFSPGDVIKVINKIFEKDGRK
jgi:two-component system, chemotaxis family, chemotaxis protein CheY